MAIDYGEMMMKYLLQDLFKTESPERKKLTDINLQTAKINLEKAKNPINLLEKKLDYISSTEDISTSKGLEAVIKKIDDGIEMGRFGDNKEQMQFINDYRQSLIVGRNRKIESNSLNKDLYNLTTPTNIFKNLDELKVLDNKDDAIELINNNVYDIISAKDRLVELGTLTQGSNLNKMISSALNYYDNALKELDTDGLSNKEIENIKSSTYAVMKENDIKLQLQLENADKIAKFESPFLKDEQLSNILSNIHKVMEDFEDNRILSQMEYDIDKSLETPSGVVSPALEKKGRDILNLDKFYEEMLDKYSAQYKKAFDAYEKNRNTKETFKLTDYRDIMSDKMHNELYNHKLNNNNGGGNNNNKFKVKNIKKADNLLKSILTSRSIVFTDDIVDDKSGTWRSKGEKNQEGLGEPSQNNWNIKEVRRDDNSNLEAVVLEIVPRPAIKNPYSHRGINADSLEKLYSKRTITLTPENFLIEDIQQDEKIGGPTFKKANGNTLSYDIFENIYKPIEINR